MAYSHQSPKGRPGTDFRSEGNSKSYSQGHTHQPEGQARPGTPHVKESNSASFGGSVIEGQKLRGYVHNDAGTSIGAVKCACCAADGTCRLKRY